MRILDLGCGKIKHQDSIGLDMNRGVNPDVLHEVKYRENLPFKENSFDLVYMIDFIEHVDNIEWLLSEVHRISVANAIVEIQYPHYSSPDFHNDVTHKHGLGIHALDHFDPSSGFGKLFSSYTLFEREFPFNINKIEVNFQEGLAGKISRYLYAKKGGDFYEAHLSAFLPIKNIHANLRIIK
jgi:hypothetical protein